MNIQDVQVPAADAFDLAATLYQLDKVGECRRFVLINSATAVEYWTRIQNDLREGKVPRLYLYPEERKLNKEDPVAAGRGHE